MLKKFTLLLTLVVAIGAYGAGLGQKKEGKLNGKVKALLAKMTLEEKIGQMTQVDYIAVKNHLEDIKKFSIGSILCGGDSEPDDVTPAGWAKLYDELQKIALESRLKIPFIWGIDAVHGHNNVDGAVIFPHNVGLGAANNVKLTEEIGRVTAEEIRGTGMQWDFAPCVAVARDERWGRTYESYGEDPQLVAKLGAAYVKGMQGKSLADKTSALACIKHYAGDGGTTNGADQGNTECSEREFRDIHLKGYISGIKAGAGSVMASYNRWNGLKLHEHKYLLTDVLKKELGFKGFIVSDWAAIDQLDKDYKVCIEKSINAGLDMVMIPNGQGQKNNYIEFITYLKELVNEGKIPLSRIDDAVSRILKIKFEMGIFEKPFTDKELTAKIGSAENREVARKAVRQSLVLLKNESNALPLSKKAGAIVISGKAADDIGRQCGGWTISWQGKPGKTFSGGTTVLEAVKNAVSKETKVIYSADASEAAKGDICVVVIGEEPYAEMKGDNKTLALSGDDIAVVEKAYSSGKPVVVVLFSGRPLILEPIINKCKAVVAAWLPGSEGGGITDVLFGDFNFTGKLPHSWPENIGQVPVNIGDKDYNPLFKFGFGLKY
jgi:beta-glucosidase